MLGKIFIGAQLKSTMIAHMLVEDGGNVVLDAASEVHTYLQCISMNVPNVKHASFS